MRGGRLLAVALGLALGGLGLGLSGEASTSAGLLRRLWMLYLIWPAVFVWATDIPTRPWKAAVGLAVVSLLLAGVHGVLTAWLLADATSPPPLGDLLLVAATFQGVLVAATFLGVAALGRSGGVMAPLCVGALLTLGPCLLDGYLERPGPPGARRAAVERALALSPPSLLAPAILGHDLFKQEAFYRSFRVGEELVTTPSLETGIREMLRIAVSLALLGLLSILPRSCWKRRRSRVTLEG